MFGAHNFRQQPTGLDLNGPNLSFPTQPEADARTSTTSISLIGIATATFEENADADNSGSLVYQWYEVGVGKLTDGTEITGSGTTTLTLSGLQSPTDTGRQFYLEADYASSSDTGNATNEPLNSEISTVTVLPYLTITQQPTDETTIPDKEAIFTVDAILSDNSFDEVISYEWVIDGEVAVDGTKEIVIPSNVVEKTFSTDSSIEIPENASNIIITIASGPGGKGGNSEGTGFPGGDGRVVKFNYTGDNRTLDLKVGSKGNDNDSFNGGRSAISKGGVGGSGSQVDGGSGGGASGIYDNELGRYTIVIGGGGGGGSGSKDVPGNRGEDASTATATTGSFDVSDGSSGDSSTFGGGGGGGGATGGSGGAGGSLENESSGGNAGESKYDSSVATVISDNKNTSRGYIKVYYELVAPTPKIGNSASFMDATGGTKITSENGYVYHFFTKNDTITFNYPGYVDVIIVGGGGGGGQLSAEYSGGGGGAGGYREFYNILVSDESYPVIVGSGGALNTNGQPSSIFGFESAGGGRGGSGGSYKGGGDGYGRSGGSGGGGSELDGGSGNTPLVSPSQGNDGGKGSAGGGRGGGGGGAGEVGEDETGDGGGDGGKGRAAFNGDTGIPDDYGTDGPTKGRWFAGGGGGGLWRNDYGTKQGKGGVGGGGDGATEITGTAKPGTPNTGGGGGGNSQDYQGNAGGSGIVIVRYIQPVEPTTVQATISGSTTPRLSYTSPVIGISTVSVSAINSVSTNSPLKSEEVTFTCINEDDSFPIIIEQINNTGTATTSDINLFNGPHTFGQVSGTNYFSFYCPDKDIVVEMDLYGGKGADNGSVSGGEGGYSRIRLTMEQNVEYVISGLNSIVNTPFIYRKASLIACVGAGGDAGSTYAGGEGGGVRMSGGSSSGRGFGSGGLSATDGNLTENGTFGSEFSGATPVSGDSIATGTNGGRSITCSKGIYYRDLGFAPCQDVGTTQFFLKDGTVVTNTGKIERGYKAGYSIIETSGLGNSNGGNGGCGATGGNGGEQGTGGGGGSGYTDGSIDIISSTLGGSTGPAKVILRAIGNPDDFGELYIDDKGRILIMSVTTPNRKPTTIPLTTGIVLPGTDLAIDDARWQLFIERAKVESGWRITGTRDQETRRLTSPTSNNMRRMINANRMTLRTSLIGWDNTPTTGAGTREYDLSWDETSGNGQTGVDYSMIHWDPAFGGYGFYGHSSNSFYSPTVYGIPTINLWLLPPGVPDF